MADELDINRTDRAASFLKGLVGWIPFVGPVSAEIIGHIIPE